MPSDPCELSLYEAFRWLLRDRTGVDIVEGAVHSKKELERDIAKSMRLTEERECTREYEAMERIAVMEPGAMDWSSKSLDFVRIVAAVGSCLHPNVTAESLVLREFFTDLNLNDRNITYLDDRTSKFTALLHLSIDSNQITSLPVLPPNLKVLHACGNQINNIEGPESPSLLHLGLAYNDLENVHVIAERFPSLLSLDLSYNRLCGLPEIIGVLHNLADIRRLLLSNNPCALTPAYRPCIIKSLPKLQTLDDSAVTATELEVAAALPVLHTAKNLGGITMQFLPKCFDGIPYTVAGDGGGYFITIHNMQGTELKSPEFVRGPPPPSSGEDIPESEREAGKHHKAPPTWLISEDDSEGNERPKIEIDITTESFDELALWKWLMVEGLHVHLHRAVAEESSVEGEAVAAAPLLVCRAELSESRLFVPPRMEECLPNLVRVGVEDTIEAQEEDGSNDVLGENDSEKVDEMPLHVAAGHCAITTGVIRVPLFVYSDATTDKLLAAPSLNQDSKGQHMYLEFEMKAWTPRGDGTAEDSVA